MNIDAAHRPLTLHVSALSNEEFELFTHSLEELATLDYGGIGSRRALLEHNYERLSFNCCDVRAWLKGRYLGMTIEKIDAVSHLYSLRSALLMMDATFHIDSEIHGSRAWTQCAV